MNPESREIPYQELLHVSLSPNSDMEIVKKCLKDGSKLMALITKGFDIYFGNRFHSDITLDIGAEETDVLYNGYVDFKGGSVHFEEGAHHKSNFAPPELLEAATAALQKEFEKINAT